MPSNKHTFNFPLLMLIIAGLAALFIIGFCRMEIDNDIVGAMPANDPVISDARHIIMNHPIQDQIVIDVTHHKDDPDILVQGGKLVKKKLTDSGLFKDVGMQDVQNLIPELVFYIIENLPIMFNKKDLNDKIRPLLDPAQIRQKLESNFSRLTSMEGIGQAELMARDPLDMKNIVMARLSHLAPSHNVRIYRGELLSSDQKHLLIVAKPISSGTDTSFSRMATDLINNISEELNHEYAKQGYVFTLTPAGAYRAALDNELMARKDTKRAILFSTMGIAILLILAFPRPFIGLLSFFPAIVGTVAAFFVFSFVYKSVSILAIGFGGAVISITVDHGIAYLLFLDRPHETVGKEAAREVWAVGFLATLTTAGAFLTLSFSGFPILAQIGQFAALGIAFSFMSVHTLFPLIFPVMPPAKRKRDLPLQIIVSKLAMKGGKYKAYAALAFALVMLCFAKPEFHVDLKSMNTVSRETIAAEDLVKNVWGDVFSRVFLMTEAENAEELLEKGDRVAALLDREVLSGTLESAFIGSMIFPGKSRAEQNLGAWKEFWGTRKKELKKNMQGFSADMGFAPDAFEFFYNLTEKKEHTRTHIPGSFLSLAGISENRDKSGWIQFSTLTPGSSYNAEAFYSKFASSGTARIFDTKLFSARLGNLLFSTFVRMVLIIGSSVVILMFLFLRDWRLTTAAIMPISFAFICTLGTLKLIGHPLDIPALMLSIVVIGMGIDYSLFFVLSHRRYAEESHPSLGLVRLAVFLASASTIIGFGVLNFADHSLLRSAGLTSLLGIFYSLVGTFAILPPVLKD